MSANDAPSNGGNSGRRGKRLAFLDELPDGQAVLRTVGSRRFLVVRRGREVHACGDTCPHRGAALHEGLVVGSQIVCPCHHGRFDLESGVPTQPPVRDEIPVYETSVEAGEVLVGRPRPFRPWHTRRGTGEGRVVIVGAGAAGSAAAETLRREGFDGRILLVSAEQELPYDRTALSKGFLGEQEYGASVGLELRPREFYEQAGVELLLGRRVVGLEPARKVVRFEHGQGLGYDSLLLATGGHPRRLGLPGERLAGVFVLRSLGDAARIRDAAAAAHHVVILGAGFLGLEAADSLRRRGLEVSVVAPEALPLAGVFGERVARWVLAQHEALGIRFHLGATARELRGDGRVREAVLEDGTCLPADLVIVAAGIEPTVGYLGRAGLVQSGAVPVDARQATPVPGIYAAGDLAAVPAPSGEHRRFEHWVEAEAQGRRAARAMLGRDPGGVGLPFFWTEAGEHTLKSVGLLHPGAGAVAVVRGRLEDSSFLAGFYAAGPAGPRLLGACAVNRDRELIAVGERIRLREALPPEELEDESADLTACATGF